MQKPKCSIVSAFHRFFTSLLAVSLCLEPSTAYGLRSQAPQEGASASDLARRLDAGAVIRGGLEEVHYRDFFRVNSSGLRKISDYHYLLNGQAGTVLIKRKTPGIQISLGDTDSNGPFAGRFIEIEEGIRKIKGENVRLITVLQGVYPSPSGSRRQSRIAFKLSDPDVSLPLIRSVTYDPSAVVPVMTLILDPRAGDFPERRFQISAGGPRTGRTLLLRLLAGKVPSSEELSEAIPAAAGAWRYQPMTLFSIRQIESRLADLDPRWNAAGQAVRERALVRIADLQKKLPLLLERIAADAGFPAGRKIRSVYLRGDYAYSDRQDSPELLVVIDGEMPWSGTKSLSGEVTLEVEPGVQRSRALSYEMAGMDDAQRARADESHPQHNRVVILYRAVPLAGDDFYRAPFPEESGREEDLEQEVRTAIAEKRQLPVVVLHAYESGAGAEVVYEPEGQTGPSLLGFLPMADLFDDAEKKISILLKRAWLQSQEGKSLNLLPVEIGQGRNGTRVLYSLKRDFTADLYAEQMFFRRVMLLNDWKGEIEDFLNWLAGQGVDPRMHLIEMYFQDGRWARMSDGQRYEAVRWLANHLYEPRFEKALFSLFEDASQTEPWAGAKIWAARGMAMMARELREEAQVLEALQRLWAETAGWGERFQADSRLSILKSARILNTPEALRWVKTLPPVVAGAEESGLEEPDEMELLEEISRNYLATLVSFKEGRWQEKIEPIREALGKSPGRVGSFLDGIRHIPDKPEVYVVSKEMLEDRDAWYSHSFSDQGALFVAREPMREAPVEVLLEAIRQKSSDPIQQWVSPVSSPPLAPPAVTEPSTAAAPEEGTPPEVTVSEITPLPEAPAVSAVKEPTIPAPQVPVAEVTPAVGAVKQPIQERPFFFFSADDPNLLDEIFDPQKTKTRSNPEWMKLYERLIFQMLKDEKPSAPDIGGRKARLMSYRLYREATAMDFSTEELYRISRGQTFFDRLTGKVLRGHVSDPRPKVLSFALIIIRVMEGMREDQELGVPPEPRPLEAGLSLAESLQRSRELMVYTSRHRDYREIPRLVAGFIGSVGRKQLNEPVPFGISSVLALRQFGQEPSIRSVPELAEAFLDNGVSHVEFIPPLPGNPPALFIHLKKLFVDSHADLQLPAVAVALLKDGQRWPELPVVEINKPWVDLSDSELSDAAARSMSKELELVEFDETRVREFSFTSEDPPQVKVRKIGQLVRLALEGGMIPRSTYAVHQRGGMAPLARYMGRIRSNQEAMKIHGELEFEALLKDPTYKRPPATPEARIKLESRLAEWESRAGLLFQLGVPQLVETPEGLSRAGEIIDRLGTKKIPFLLEDWSPYLPLIGLIVSRTPEEAWVIGDLDAKTLLNRFGQSRSVVQDPSVKGLVQQLADSFPDSQGRVSFLVALNSALLKAIPAKPEKPFRDISMDEAQKGLVKSAEALLGPEVGQSPSAALSFAVEREALAERIRLIQQRMWELFQSGLEEPSAAEEMEKVLEELEQALRQMQSFGTPPTAAAPAVKLASAAQFEVGVRAIHQWVQDSLGRPVPPGEQVRLDLLRSLTAVRRLIEAGQLEEAVVQAAVILPQLQGEERARVEQVRERLFHKRVEEALAPVRQLLESGLFDEVLKSLTQLQEVYRLAESGQTLEAFQLGTALLPQMDAEMAARFQPFLADLAGKIVEDVLAQLQLMAEAGQLQTAFEQSAQFLPFLQGEQADRFKSFREDLAQKIADGVLQQVQNVPSGSEISAIEALNTATQLLKGFPDLQQRLKKRERSLATQKQRAEQQVEQAAQPPSSLQEESRKLQAQFQQELAEDPQEYGAAEKFLDTVARGKPVAPGRVAKLIHHLEEKQKKGSGVLLGLDRKILDLAKKVLEEEGGKAGLEEAGTFFAERFIGQFADGDPARMAPIDEVPYLQTGERVTLKIRIDPASWPSLGRIFLQPGAVVPAGWLEDREIVSLPLDPEAARAVLNGEKAGAGDIALLAPEASLSSFREWDALLRFHGVAGLQIAPEALPDIERMSPAETAAFLSAVRQSGGLMVILGAEVQERTESEQFLFIQA